MNSRRGRDRDSGLRCSIESCKVQVFRGGWCQMHYVHWLRHGDPLVTLRPPQEKRVWNSVEERFWAKVDRWDPDYCWEWTASRSPKGYGAFNLEGKGLKAHRVSYEWLIGPIPAGLQIDHLCLNPGCVNPKHLEPVTGSVNQVRGARYRKPRVYWNGLKTHCPYGHPYDEANTRWYRNMRYCRACVKRTSLRRYHERRKAMLNAVA